MEHDPNLPALAIDRLTFAYGKGVPVLHNIELRLPRGARCLLVGHNGSGKSTLLRVIAGRHLLADARVRVLGRPAFSDTSLVDDVALLGGVFALDVDIGVDEILARRPADAARRRRLMEVLAIDEGWRMARVSDGQRRRVQLLLGLEQPKQLYLLDEISTDLDLVARADIHAFLRQDAEERGATMLYATHVLDRLERWATHLAFLHQGELRWMGELGPLDAGTTLTDRMESWLRSPPGHVKLGG